MDDHNLESILVSSDLIAPALKIPGIPFKSCVMLCVTVILCFKSALMKTSVYLVDVPYIGILHPDLCEQAADVRLEQSLVAVPRSVFCYSDLLMVLPICEQRDRRKGN